jgi:hypothetical protein
MVDDDQEDVFKDPAAHHPFIHLMIRYFTLLFLLFLSIFIPGITFYLVSIVLKLSTTLGTILGLLTFALYLRLLWKKELWNLIKR